MNKINSFDGKYAFLSNFYPCSVYYEGLDFPSSEHAFQAAKTLNIKARRAFTLESMTPAMAKYLGAALSIRPNWDSIRLEVMTKIIKSKFGDPELQSLLLDTGDAELIEGNTRNDTFWGVCNGVGTNFLGKTLMDLRADLTSRGIKLY